MKSIIQECKICNVKSRWTYRVSIKRLHKNPIILCDDCLINSYNEIKKNRNKNKDNEKMEINSNYDA